MKYVIKIKDKLGRDLSFTVSSPKHIVSEHTGSTNVKPLTFESMGDAEVYAQNHEFKNYEVVPE